MSSLNVNVHVKWRASVHDGLFVLYGDEARSSTVTVGLIEVFMSSSKVTVIVTTPASASARLVGETAVTAGFVTSMVNAQ